MHPKRHPLVMEYALGCDRQGRLTALRARIVGDTGAYASVGTKVLERAAGHASGAYHVPAADIEARTVYTNNLPCGAMRGFGVNQVTFAMEGCIDMLCEQGRLRPLAVPLRQRPGRRAHDRHRPGPGRRRRRARLPAGPEGRVLQGRHGRPGLRHQEHRHRQRHGRRLRRQDRGRFAAPGWSSTTAGPRWGRGCTPWPARWSARRPAWTRRIMEVRVDTASGARSGMTTASRATSLVGNALIDACAALKRDLSEPAAGGARRQDLRRALALRLDDDAAGRRPRPSPITPTATPPSWWSSTTRGGIARVVAAHDAGRIVNPTLFEGQIEGAVVMGLGYALSEDLPLRDGLPASSRLADLGLLRARRRAAHRGDRGGGRRRARPLRRQGGGRDRPGADRRRRGQRPVPVRRRAPLPAAHEAAGENEVSLYLRDAVHVDWRTLKFTSGHMRVEEGETGGIRFIDGPSPADLGEDDKVLDCRGRLVTRSFACGHHHAYSALALGMPPPAQAPADFQQKLQHVWWKLDRALDPELVLLSALATALDCARNGVTFVIDHHSSPHAVEGSLDAIAGAFDGGRASACCPAWSSPTATAPPPARRGWPRPATAWPPASPAWWGCTPRSPSATTCWPRPSPWPANTSSGIHVHAAEDAIDQETTFAYYGCRVVERFKEAGVLEFGAHHPGARPAPGPGRARHPQGLAGLAGREHGEQPEQPRRLLPRRGPEQPHHARHRRHALRHAALGAGRLFQRHRSRARRHGRHLLAACAASTTTCRRTASAATARTTWWSWTTPRPRR